MLEVGFSTTTGGGPCFCTHFRKAGNYSVMMGMFNPIAARISCRVRTFLARRWHSGWWKQPESMQAPRVLRTVGMSVELINYHARSRHGRDGRGGRSGE